MSESLARELVPNGAAPSGEALVTVLDRLLDTGAVLDGQLVVSVAGVDLVFVGLRVLLASMDTAMRMTLAQPAARPALAEVPR